MVLTGKQKPFLTALTGWPEKPIIRWKGVSRLESYVQFPIPQMTTFILLGHLGLGCCWHHAHTCTATCCESPAVTAGLCGCDVHAHNETKHGQYGYSDDTRHRHQCDGDRCLFVRWEPSPDQKGELHFDLCPLDVALSPTKSELIYSRQTCGQDHSLRDDGLRLRAHLLFSVLLI